jgi:hypothetical protein
VVDKGDNEDVEVDRVCNVVEGPKDGVAGAETDVMLLEGGVRA